MVVPPQEYLRGVRRLCEQRGALLILDEVQAGLGRSGKLWAFEHFGVVPDLLVLGKGLSGGLYPITATVLRSDLETVFHPDPFIHISTFGGAELGCRVARRVLEISSDPAFLSHVNELARLFWEGIEGPGGLVERHRGLLKGLRQLGLLMGLELRDELSGPVLTKTAYDEDLLVIYAGNDSSVCQLLPPLTMPIADVAWVMQRLDRALRAARGLLPVVRVQRKVKETARGAARAVKGAAQSTRSAFRGRRSR
jgi:acetylornithine/succinyldiaminopimelate/putrescine aminotransferase